MSSDAYLTTLSRNGQSDTNLSHGVQNLVRLCHLYEWDDSILISIITTSGDNHADGPTRTMQPMQEIPVE